MVPNVRPCVSEYCEFYSGNKGSGSRGETGGAWITRPLKSERSSDTSV
jgi:hypothetical protein